MSSDIVEQLSAMMRDEKREAFDAGCLKTIDMVIELAEMGNGRLSTHQLLNFKEYITRQLRKANEDDRGQDGEGMAGQETPIEDTPPVQPSRRVFDAEGVQFFGPSASNQSGGEEAPAGERQASEAITQA